MQEYVGSEGVAEDTTDEAKAMPGVRIFIPYPLIDPIEARLVKRAAEPGYSGPPVPAMRDRQYVQNLQAVARVLARLGIDSPRPEPATEGTDRLSVVTVSLERGITADAVRRALPGFRVEEILAGG